jgi:DNA repair exonuclease SbcCD ATPase subunit
MRFISFKTLEGRNFLSFGDTPVKIDLRPGVNTIIGTNLDKEDSKNGAGKSSVIELLYYALYGTTLREISKDHVQNSLTKKRCEVSLDFDVTCNSVTDSYKVTRFLNPSKCILTKNGEEITRSTLVKTNNLINEIIRTPSTVFQNSVIMSVNATLPFLALPKTDKRKFIESVLGLEVFTQMVLKTREEYNTAKKEYEINYSKYDTLNSELSFNLSQLNNYQENKTQRLKELNGKLLKINEDLTEFKSKILPVDLSLIDSINTQIEINRKTEIDQENILKQLNNHLTKINAEISLEQKQIQKIEENKDTCPTCNREYSDEHVNHTKTLIEQHNKILSNKNNLLKQLQEKIEKVTKISDDIRSNNMSLTNELRVQIQNEKENSNINFNIDFLEKNRKSLLQDIEYYTKQENNDLKGKVNALSGSVNEFKIKTDQLNNELNILETVKFVISEEGIKSFIVKKILTVLNSRLAYYLQKLEANCLCKFNEFFDEEILDENSNPKSYFNFSGGERKRIDLACLFAFADIRRLQGDVNFNIVFYDELLDSSLDDRGVTLAISVLRDRFTENNESCYIITHRGTWVSTKSEHVIHVIKQNGISTIES